MTSIRFPLQDQLQGFSKALFSTWLYHNRFNTLFDAGEGVSSSLYNRVFGIRRIFLSHGHADHIAGLVNLINIRNLGAGDQTASLKIYYPRDNKLIDFIIDYLSRTQRDLSFELEWIQLEAGQIIQLEDQKSKVFLEAFRTKHSQRQLSLGYNIVEKRRRLKPEYQNLAQKDLNKIVWEKGKSEIATEFKQIVFSYGGDSKPINPKNIKGTLFLCHECTYLAHEDDERDFQQHSILYDVLQTAKEAEVKTLLLFHTSLRYNFETIRHKINETAREVQTDCKILLLYGDTILDISSEDSRKRNNHGRSK